MCDTEANDRPKWLLELENRKRKPRLAHEAGAGAPCVTCKTACPGLDLHFWRKICKNCKCSKDDHDVQDEDFPQFDLLFGSSRKHKKKPILLNINNEKEHAVEAFEWVPPNVTTELATDYMKALPTEKLPIKGSTGAALRRQLLQKQLPLHDIDHKACDMLSEQEQKQFEKYLDNIKKYVGQGTVTKILSARPFDRALMTPANATDMQRFSPQHKPNTPSNTIQLRTPSSFTPKAPYKKDLHENLNKQEHPVNLETTGNANSAKTVPIFEKYNIEKYNGETVRSELVKSGLYSKGVHTFASKLESNQDILNKNVPRTDDLKPLNPTSAVVVVPEIVPQYCKEHKNVLQNPHISHLQSKPTDDAAAIAESILADAFLPPSKVHTNDIIGSTLGEKDLMYIREKLANKYSNQENSMPYNTPSFSKELDSNDLLRENNDLPSQHMNRSASTNEETDITTAPKNPGILIPSQDEMHTGRNIIKSKPLKAEREVMKPVSQLIQSIPLNSSTTNVQGKEQLREGISPISSKLIENSSPVSSTQANLNSITTPFTVINSEKLQNQIFPYESPSTINQPVQIVPSVENLKHAINDLTIDSKLQKCHKCEEEIRVGDVAVVTEKAKDAIWHPGCFVCNTCNELLVDLVYFYYKNKLYCGRDLAALLGIPRCFACDELIFVREYTVAEGHNYHVKHFCCWDCDLPLAGKLYIIQNDRPLCLPCYQNTYAETCNMCNKVIGADQQRVAVKDLSFHATEDCFCCFICKKNLLNGKMAIKENKLLCSKECISKFLHP